jgi:glycosyltransferase involved in cell wall biosynthesis
MPTKNRLALLQRAVQSILKQSVRNIELIVVSDGSNDGTCDYVRSIESDVRVRLIHNEQSQGACNARNQAIALAEGEYITGLDDDDYFLPNRIEDFLNAWKKLESEGNTFSCLFDSCLINEGKKSYVHNTAPNVSPSQIQSLNYIGNQVFSKLERVRTVGGFDPQMPAWQDWELWARLLEAYGPAINIQKTSYYMDTSHEFERITQKSPEKILNAARLFYAKHCTRVNLCGILMSLGNYPQVKFSVSDLARLLCDRQWRFVARKLLRGNYMLSMNSSIPLAGSDSKSAPSARPR